MRRTGLGLGTEVHGYNPGGSLGAKCNIVLL